MPAASTNSYPAFRVLRVLALAAVATLLALAYMGAAAADDAKARDIVISDSSTPLNAGVGSAFGDGTAAAAGSLAATSGAGNCTTPNFSVLSAGGGAATNDSHRLAIQKAFSTNVSSGDNIYFCNITAVSGVNATNTYAPSEAGTSGTSIDLSGTPGVTIAPFPGSPTQTPILQANRGPQPALSFGTSGLIHTAAFTNNPVAGSFTITFPATAGAACVGTTGTIPWNANTATIQAAVSAVSGCDPSAAANGVVVGGPDAPGAFTLTEEVVSVLNGGTPTANASGLIGGSDANFFSDTNTQGRTITLSNLTLSQAGAATGIDGGFISISNSTTPGTLNLNNVNASGFATTGRGGVVRAENVNLTTVNLGTAKTNTANGTPLFGNAAESNSAVGGGGAVFAEGNVTATGLNANNNNVADDGAVGTAGNGGVILAGGNTGGGNVTISGATSNFQKNRNLDAAPGSNGNGGAISAAGTVTISNASTFGGQPLTTNNFGGNLSTAGRGGAIEARSVVAGPGASFIRNEALGTGAIGGAIIANGVQINGSSGSPAQFLGNRSDGGGAIAITGGVFTGTGTTVDPRVCGVQSAITNATFGNGTDNSTTAAGANVAGALGGGAVRVSQEATDTGFLGTPAKCTVDLSASDFNGNIAGTGGGGAVLAAGGAITTSAATQFRNNDAGNTASLANPSWGAGDGGAINATSTRETNITVPATAFTANQAGGSGGAVSVAGTGTKSFTGTTFNTNSAGNRADAAAVGGAINAGAAVTLSGASFTSNAVGGTAGFPDSGGALALLAGNSTVTQSTFTSNNTSTHGDGGAIAIAGGAPSITNQTLSSNRAGTTAGNGGAMVITGGTPTIQQVNFTGNAASGTGANGGAIHATTALGVSPVDSFERNEFRSNSATGSGGAISSTANLTTSETDFIQNYSSSAGGAVSSTSGTLSIAQSDFNDNGSLGDGGALSKSGGTRTVLDETAFTDNQAGVNSSGTFIAGGNTSDGGAVKLGAGTYLITESTLAENEAANNGGAVDAAANGSAAGDGVVLSDLLGNLAGRANAAQTSLGGALNLSGASAQNVVDTQLGANSVAQTNTNASATTRGGAIAANGGNLNLTRTTFSGNTASSAAAVAPGGVAAAGGGVYMGSGNAVTATNSTFTGNGAPVAAVAWSENASSALTFTSSTIAGNTAPSGSSILVSGRTAAGAINVTNSIIAEAATNGSGCVAGTGGTLVNGGGNVLTDTTDCGGNSLVGTGGAPAAKVTAAQLDLKPLANNGGPTETRALGVDSVAAASAGVNALGASPIDQRGLTRPTTNQSSGSFQLTVVDLTVTKAGTGRGTVTSSPAGIDCGPTCNSQTAEFAQQPSALVVTLTAVPAEFSVFVSWSGPCVTTTATSCQVTLDQAKFVTANFQDTRNTLTLVKEGNGEGLVTSSPAGIDCGTTCVGNFTPETVVTLTAEALGKSKFEGWGGACAAAEKEPTCTVTMEQSRTVSANFSQTARAKIVKVNQGTIRVPGNRTISVGRVECVNGTCRIVQATARVKVGGKTYRASVKGQSGSFTTGKSKTVKVVVPQAAYRNLRPSKSGSVTLVLRAEAEVPSSLTETSKNLTNGLRR